MQRIIQRIGKRFARRSLILMYHRVGESASDPWSLCVSPDHFAEHLEVLRKFGYPMRLQELALALGDGNVPHRAIALTFDDGYADNLYNAKPLLERYGIPATVFLTTGQIAQGREFWWDELERLLLQPGILPEALCLKINGSTHRWKLDKATRYSDDDYRRNRHLNAWDGAFGSRHHLYYSIWQLIQPLPADEQWVVLEEIRIWAGNELAVRPTHRPLSPEEICTLGQDNLIEVGAHTETHPFLSAHPEAFQRREIQQSKARLENIIGYTVRGFAYPYGDYTAKTVDLIRESGFTCACTTVADTVWRYTDCFQMPRLAVEDWDGEEFARQLVKSFGTR